MNAPTGRRLGWSLALLAFAQLIFSLDINIVYVALPDIGRSLGFDGQTQQWVVSAYTVFAGGFLLFGGRAADLLGRRRVFVTALALYAISSLVGGFASAPFMLIAARAVQGVGGALLLPSTLALISNLFAEGRVRNRALAIWGGAGASGLTLGALLGGVLSQWFGWPAVFFVNVVLAGVAAAAAFALIPRDVPRSESRTFDLPGAASVTLAATLFVYALVQGPADGWGTWPIITALAISIAAAVSFVVIESRSTDPLMPLRLLGNRNVAVGVMTTFVYMGTFGALPYFLTVLLQNVHRLSALQTGLAFLLPSVAIATGTQLGERLLNHVGGQRALLAGFALGLPGTIVLALGFSSSLSYWALVPGLVISGLGQGVTWTAMWIVASTAVAPHEQGVANGLASTALNIGNAVGLAVLVAVSTTVRSHVGGSAGGDRFAVMIAAAIMILGVLAATRLRRKGSETSSVSDDSKTGTADSDRRERSVADVIE
ncbi:MFS family permease [Rhodococcus sp. 27YEA15]|uniref:MFS transporter n=1 Tax=Rhodococcus sp. 27YEA15 TaxID=3156259 RepID=UPI003C7D54BD